MVLNSFIKKLKDVNKIIIYNLIYIKYVLVINN